jgi:hypothetical protein
MCWHVEPDGQPTTLSSTKGSRNGQLQPIHIQPGRQVSWYWKGQSSSTAKKLNMATVTIKPDKCGCTQETRASFDCE